MYKELGSMCAVADALQCTPNSVKYHLRASGVAINEKPKQRRSDGERIEQVRAALKEWGPMDAEELAGAMSDSGHDINVKTLRNLISRWRKAHGSEWIRVERWVRQLGKPCAVYDLGPAPDALYRRLSKAMQSKRHRAKFGAVLRARARKTPASLWPAAGI